jgi:hypothetical protein
MLRLILLIGIGLLELRRANLRLRYGVLGLAGRVVCLGLLKG